MAGKLLKGSCVSQIADLIKFPLNHRFSFKESLALRFSNLKIVAFNFYSRSLYFIKASSCDATKHVLRQAKHDPDFIANFILRPEEKGCRPILLDPDNRLDITSLLIA